MKNNIYKFLSLLFVLSLFFSCNDDNKEKYLFEDNPNARFEKLKEGYVNTLTSAENGWIGYYNPNNNVGGFNILMKFDKDGNVNMASDYNKGANDNTITYRIDKKLKIQLVFETHGILHQIYETAQNGVEGEYVFNILNVIDDTIELESATDFGYGGSEVTKLTLKKATTEQWNFDKVYENTSKITNGYKTSKYWRTIYVEGTDIKESFSYVDGYSSEKINRYSVIKKINSKGGVDVNNVPVIITDEGFNFLKPYVINGKEVTVFKYDEANNRFVSEDGGQKTIIEHTDDNPVIYYPAVSMGEDGKLVSQLYSYSRWWPTVKAQSSFLFKKLIYEKSKTKRFDIYLNSDDNGALPKKEEAIIRVISLFGTFKILCTVERVKNQKIMFKIKGDLKDYVRSIFKRKYVKKLTDVLTSPKGFYVEETQHKTPFGMYKGYLYISVANPQVRFSTLSH